MTTCSDVQTRAAESALGLLDGADRADVLAHLEQCETCRALIADLSSIGDALVLLAPSAEPSAGFERRVLQEIGARSAPRWRFAAAAAAAAVLFLLGGFAVGRARTAGTDDIRSVTMRTPSGRTVGDAYVHGADTRWVFVTVPDWKADTAYQLRVTYADGQTTNVAGDGMWAATLDDPSGVHRLELVDADGVTWCSSDAL